MPERRGVKADKERPKSINEFVKIDTDVIKAVVLCLVILFLFLFFNSFFGIFREKTCGDGTLYGECSVNPSYFCSEGILVQDAFRCGCPEGAVQKEDFCESPYQTSIRMIGLDYVFKGASEKIYFKVYKGMKDYLLKHPQINLYMGSENYSLQDFKLKIIDEPEQKKLLIPLVVRIQNLAHSKEDQARIAISLVQNIPYEEDAFFDPQNPALWKLKYPYDVLYKDEGLCGSKSDLLAFLLKELGYEVVIFHYYSENHEAIGLRCPERYSFNHTGYCFVETTYPAIISYSNGEYSEMGALSSVPEIVKISDGISLEEDMEEYRHARELSRIQSASRKNEGRINMLEYFRYNQLAKRYGLEPFS